MQFAIDIALSLFYFCGFLLVCAWSWRFWMMYINLKFLAKFNDECIMLEIKLPREIFKSPLATEVALATLLQNGGLGHKYAKYFNGNLPAYSSLEIASLEGVIHFYIRINKKFKSLIEANFYAQYPGIEIVESDDYTKMIRYHHLTKDVSLWGESYKLGGTWVPTNPKTGEPFHKSKNDEAIPEKADQYKMPADFLPIKTYVDFGLDKDPKEEFKTDPLTPLLETMGSIGKGEYFWYQIMVQDESVYNGEKMSKFYVNERSHEHVSLSDMVKARKLQIRTAGYNKKSDTIYDKYGAVEKIKIGKDADGNDVFEDAKYKYETPKAISKKEMELTIEEKDEIEAINKKLSKPLACIAVRLLYVTKKEHFNPEHIQTVLSFPRIFNGANKLAYNNVTDPYNFPWENIGKKRSAWRAEEMFEEYVEREGFFPHIPKRESLDSWEDIMFHSYSMKSRKIFRMIYEAIFYPFDHPHPSDVSIVNLEELATLWHLPGQVAGTPTLPRIDSTKGVAPSNLPQ